MRISSVETIPIRVPLVRPFAADGRIERGRPLREQLYHRLRTAILDVELTPGQSLVIDELAADCEKDGAYEFLLVSGVLYLPGGVGSPANAYAIK